MKKKLIKPFKSVVSNLPLMISIILVLGLINEFITFNKIAELFTQNQLVDTILGSFFGSIFAGNSMNSYIIGRELMVSHVSMYAITAFLVSWVTVGLLQIPIESVSFGKKFAIERNVISAIFAIIVAFITVMIGGLL